MIKPVGHRVLLKQRPVEEVTQSGIILHKKTVMDEKLAGVVGTVVAIGDSCWKDQGDGTPWAKVGDMVYYGQYAGLRVREDPDDPESEEYILVNDLDITAVVEK
jgi:chaperonin GroES